MSAEKRFLIWLAILIVIGGLIYLLRGALFPFIAGMGIAYFLDPAADRLEAWGCPRSLATALILFGFLVVLVIAMIILFPLLQDQVVGLVRRAPGYIDRLWELAQPYLAHLQAKLGEEHMTQLRDAAEGMAGEIIAWIGGILKNILSSGAALFGLLSILVIMPVVAFYLLRDWDRLVAWIDDLLPRPIAPTVREQAREIDARLSGFVRGQTLVCLILAAFYAVALTAIGLDFGLLVGLIAGLVSFIPYVGTAIGIGSGLGIAFAQFDSWISIALVAAIFAVGQMLQDFVLTPRLIGDRIGLHPALVLFALVAGGVLMGFTGVLLAMPFAAALGVIVRYAVTRYRESELYHPGGDDDDGTAVTKP